MTGAWDDPGVLAAVRAVTATERLGFEGRILTLSRDEILVHGDEDGAVTLQVTDRASKETVATLLSEKDILKLRAFLERAQQHVTGG